MKPSWIKVPLSGATGTPPLGWIIRGREEGIVVAVLDSASPVAEDEAVIMIELCSKDVSEFVAVGLML